MPWSPERHAATAAGFSVRTAVEIGREALPIGIACQHGVQQACCRTRFGGAAGQSAHCRRCEQITLRARRFAGRCTDARRDATHYRDTAAGARAGRFDTSQHERIAASVRIWQAGFDNNPAVAAHHLVRAGVNGDCQHDAARAAAAVIQRQV